MLSYSAVPKKNLKSAAYRSVNGNIVIVNLRNRTINILNSVASRIWELVDGIRTNENIIKKIYQEFDVGVLKAKKDYMIFLSDMKKNNLISSPDKIMDARKISTESLGKTSENIFGKLRELVAKNKIPLMGHLDLTYKCNLNCKHCYLSPEKKEELSTSEVKNILDQIAKAGTLYLTLSGGEIFTRKDIFEIISYTRKLNFAVRLLTNGTLLDKDKIELISSFSPEMVAISIYSSNPKIHDEITGMPGSFFKSFSAAKLLREKGVNVKISTVIMKQNVNDYASIAVLAKNIGAQFQADYRISPKTNGDKSPLKFYINDRELRRTFLDPVLQKRDDSLETDISLKEDYQGIFNIVPCGAGHMSFYVSPYGDVYPCVQLPIRCGNLKKESFSDVWNNSDQMLSIRSIRIIDLPKCSDCKFFQYCRLCIGLNYVEEGDIFVPSKRTCKEARLRKELGQKRR